MSGDGCLDGKNHFCGWGEVSLGVDWEAGKVKVKFFFATLYILTAVVVSHRRRRRRCWRKTSIRQRATMSLQKGEKNVKMEENQNGNEKSCISHDKIIIISHRCRFAPTRRRWCLGLPFLNGSAYGAWWGGSWGGFMFWRVIFHF